VTAIAHTPLRGFQALRITPLLSACNFGHTDVVRALVQLGANVEATRVCVSMIDMVCPATCCKKPRFMDCTSLLLGLRVRQEVGRTSLTVTEVCCCWVLGVCQEDGCTPLVVAAMRGDASTVVALLEGGAEVDRVGVRNRAYLLVAPTRTITANQSIVTNAYPGRPGTLESLIMGFHPSPQFL
jgi:hypothetical protein